MKSLQSEREQFSWVSRETQWWSQAPHATKKGITQRVCGKTRREIHPSQSDSTPLHFAVAIGTRELTDSTAQKNHRPKPYNKKQELAYTLLYRKSFPHLYDKAVTDIEAAKYTCLAPVQSVRKADFLHYLIRAGCHCQFTKPTQSGLGSDDQRAFATHCRGFQDLSSAQKQQCANTRSFSATMHQPATQMHTSTRILFLTLNEWVKNKGGGGLAQTGCA